MAISRKENSTPTIHQNPNAAGQENQPADKSPWARHEWIAYAIAIASGLGGGFLEVWLADLSTTALLVTVAAMALGCAWPRRPWRWALAVGLCVPLAVAIEWNQHPGRGMLYGSFAMLAPAMVAAFGGSFMRKLVGELFRG